MRDMNAFDPLPMTLGAKVQPVADVPVSPIVEFERGDHLLLLAFASLGAVIGQSIGGCMDGLTALEVKSLTGHEGPEVIVSREWRNGELVKVTYGPALPGASSDVWVSDRPDVTVGEAPAFVLTRDELQALAEQQALHDGSALID